ncbi:MAG: hypothetical protein ACTSRG_05850 [Candidatus Helarchaeota archaeon]
MGQFTYADIPDSVASKSFLPLGEHIWKLYKELGWEFIANMLSDKDVAFNPKLAEAVNEKFKTAVESAKMVLNGQIENPEKVLTTWFFPPLIYVRSDLQMGSTKLIYGASTDITFVVVNDFTNEVDLLLNGHMEDGVPVDYFYILGDDELFDRRHMKLGIKLREVPKKTKDGFIKTGFRLLDILRDIRNERAPEFADSAYSICMLWETGGLNMTFEFSNWGSLADVWDGLSAKKIYGLSDYYFCYVPWPPMLNLFVTMGRFDFTIKMTGLLTHHQLFINALEPKHMALFRDDVPEFWDFILKTVKETGIATPYMTLNCKPPDFKNKDIYKKENFDWTFPIRNRVKPFEWDLDAEEVFGGILTDITHETPDEEIYGKEHIISMGVGK